MAKKIKNYFSVIIQYISIRFELKKYLSITLSLCILGTTEIVEPLSFAGDLLFVLSSLFVFRLLEDAWSYHLDRIYHPKRLYLKPKIFKFFIGFIIFVFFCYFSVVFLVSSNLALIVFILFTASFLFYLLFYKVKLVMIVIPLLQYPVFILVISDFSLSPQLWFLAFGALFMILSSNFIKAYRIINSTLKYKILLVLITGVLVFHPWLKTYNLLFEMIFIFIPVFLITFSSMKEEPLFPVLAFPLLHIIDVLFVL